MLKEDSRVAVWMENEVNSHNTAINSTFRKTAIKKMAIGYGSSDSPTRSIYDSMSTSNKKTTDHAKVRGEGSAAKHKHIT
jgi:hypothetical protein